MTVDEAGGYVKTVVDMQKPVRSSAGLQPKVTKVRRPPALPDGRRPGRAAGWSFKWR
jgi:hypothetical protein